MLAVLFVENCLWYARESGRLEAALVASDGLF
jgi:hypothetical protein